MRPFSKRQKDGTQHTWADQKTSAITPGPQTSPAANGVPVVRVEWSAYPRRPSQRHWPCKPSNQPSLSDRWRDPVHLSRLILVLSG
ncbi:hypothetical protein PGTUg99_020529 [Puccinia graminis f. sp. tritici]|uniref:Uncharacterized protein n=1 Tax=Puccinia graminis f. sp. tritici TaxID=56615 RepID=A0A5B0Q0W3_PUCGR|nr:hypothetical protein PGTUg99_020529 [Puccinia graminis f. sp. tritici]